MTRAIKEGELSGIYSIRLPLSTCSALRGIAQREGKSFSSLTRDILETYAKSHCAGNPNYKLEQFEVEGFKAYPTIWDYQSTTYDKLKQYDLSDLEEMANAADSFKLRAQKIIHTKREEAFRTAAKRQSMSMSMAMDESTPLADSESESESDNVSVVEEEVVR